MSLKDRWPLKIKKKVADQTETERNRFKSYEERNKFGADYFIKGMTKLVPRELLS